MTARHVIRALGWSAAALASAAILSGAAMALVAERRHFPAPLYIAVAVLPPTAASVAAIADPAPVVMDEAPDLPFLPAETENDTPPKPPAGISPAALHQVAQLPSPVVDAPTTPDLAAPPPVAKTEPLPKPKPRPDRKAADPKPETAEKPEDTPKREKAAKPKAASVGATAPVAGAKATGGAKVTPAAYAQAVMKKVRATKKKLGSGRGTAVIGFTIGTDGQLTDVMVLQSSGDQALDKTALDHIRRSAPFPAPPESAGRSYSFEFVGK